MAEWAEKDTFADMGIRSQSRRIRHKQMRDRIITIELEKQKKEAVDRVAQHVPGASNSNSFIVANKIKIKQLQLRERGRRRSLQPVSPRLSASSEKKKLIVAKINSRRPPRRLCFYD